MSEGGQRQVVVFSVGGRVLATDILKVREILRMVEITPFPGMPPFALGAINVRGRIVPVINLRSRLGLPDAPPGAQTCIMLVVTGAQVIGFLADAVTEVVDLPESRIEPAAAGPPWMHAGPFSGIGKLPERMLVILEPDRLLSEQEGRQLPAALTAETAPPSPGTP